jgi:hypothetical protein
MPGESIYEYYKAGASFGRHKGCVLYEDLEQDKRGEEERSWVMGTEKFLLCGNGGCYLRA